MYPNVPLKDIFDFEYPQKSRVSAVEKEKRKTLCLPQNKKTE